MQQTLPLTGAKIVSGTGAHRACAAILSSGNILGRDYPADDPGFEVPADVEYRGHRIVWDTRQVEGTSLWTGRAAVVAPPDTSGIKGVHKIKVSTYFVTEKEVRDYLIGAAKDRIDKGLYSER